MEHCNYNGKCIGIGTYKVEVFLPFVASILYILKTFATNEICQKTEHFDCKNDYLVFILMMFIGEMANVIFFIISFALRTKTKEQPCSSSAVTSTPSKISFLLSKNSREKSRVWVRYLLVLLTSVIYGVSMGFILFFQYSFDGKPTQSTNDETTIRFVINEMTLELRLFTLVFIVPLSWAFFHYPMYRHKVFSLGLISIALISYIIAAFFNKASNWTMLYIILTYSLFSFREVLHKYYMQIKSMLSVWIIFIEGLFGTILTLIVLASIDKLAAPMIEIFTNWDLGRFFLAYFVICFSYDFISILAKYHFEPTIMPVGYSFSIFCWKIGMWIYTGNVIQYNAWVFIIGSVPALFACLVYNEIIILYCCDFEQDTRKEITQRSTRDSHLMIEIRDFHEETVFALDQDFT